MDTPKRKRGRPRKNPLPESPKILKSKLREDLDKNWQGLYEIIKNHDYHDQSYSYRQGMLTSAQTKLFDKIVDWMEKKFYEATQ